MDLQTPVRKVGKLYQAYESRLEKLHITKLEDFLFHLPFRYEDYSVISPINNLMQGSIVTIQGKVKEIKNIYTKSHKKIQKAIITDETGDIEVMWFNQPFLSKVIHAGDDISLSGRVEKDANKMHLISPEYEIFYPSTTKTTLHTGRLVPIYPETQGVSSKWLRRQIHKLLIEYASHFPEYLPEDIVKKNNLLSLQSALETIHFPKTLDDTSRARERLAFDELFLLQITALKRKQEWKKNKNGFAFTSDTFTKKINEFTKSLPFTLTTAQQKTINEIFSDLSSHQPMNRLLQGDVGSGKTIVATLAMYLSFLNGYQSVLMAPTEILAEQHYQTIHALLQPFGIPVGLATGSKKIAVGTNEFSVLIGTHAVLSEKVTFDKLGLVVIDEQQRFGVQQRAILRNKGENPHMLTMTATPIPRTIALTMYGDLDLSVLDEMPVGRKEIKTWLVPTEKRKQAYDWIAKQIHELHTQAFIICPFIEESENMQTIKAAKTEFLQLQEQVFKHLRLGLLHGKLKPKEKEAVLQQFGDKKIDILVATPVVEVGIDFPNATIIMIEAAERFGLSQLHQLRGRVGRGDKQSYCLLFTESKAPQSIQRLSSLQHMHIGSQLAELDLKLRGAGDVYGTMQHGMSQLKVASFSDMALIEKTKQAARETFVDIHHYPQLEEKIKNAETENISPN